MTATASVMDKVKGWRPYVEAKLGFRNHWYPALMSSEVEEGKYATLKLLGENLLFSRIDGKVRCMRDRCMHRGVNLSARPECYAKGTITCWYHGWTYKWDTGELVGILTNPDSAQIGKHRIRVFPVDEQKGFIFVFIGDMAPPPLAHDVPPNFLDEDFQLFGKRRTVNSNWRVGVENGFDSGHIWIHKDAEILTVNDIVLPVGFVPLEGGKNTRLVEDENGPKGVFDLLGEGSMPVFETYLFGEKVAEGHFGATRVSNEISIWLPGVLKVDPWPQAGMAQFEWYIPIDEGSHVYFQTLGKRVKNAAERKAYEREFQDKWMALSIDGFNDVDVWAREAGEAFYKDDMGWIAERLYEPDVAIVEWRKFASKHNRGIQKPEHIYM